MVGINSMINHEVMRKRLLAKSELAGEVLHILGMPKISTAYIEMVGKVQERFSKVREDYLKFQSGISF